MRNNWIMIAVVCLVALPVCAGDPGRVEDTDDPKDPHRALRDAVQDIRVHYAPSAGGSKDFFFGEGFSRSGLGIIIGRVSSVLHGEGAPGAEILAVTPGSPADEAGLQPGDIVVAWNGESLVEDGKDPRWTAADASRELVARSRELEEGDSVTLRYLRDGKELEVTLEARELDFGSTYWVGTAGRPHVDVRATPDVVWKSAKPWFLPQGWLDMELVEINPELGAYFGSDAGVLVVRGPEGDETLGIESGDVILRIGNREVKNPEHVMRILRSYEPDEELSVDIVRHGRSETLTGTVPEASFRFGYTFRGSEEEDE
ncbi:MAG: PDZ domain-containing protein [Acidobacteriota bacterium]|nr:PDZ domain-containing protein [Acidobacteriota bacterium]